MARILAALIIVQVVLACGGSDAQSPVAPSTVAPQTGGPPAFAIGATAGKEGPPLVAFRD